MLRVLAWLAAILYVITNVVTYFDREEKLKRLQQEVKENPGSKIEWVGSGYTKRPVIKYSNRNRPSEGSLRPETSIPSSLQNNHPQGKTRQEGLVWKFDSVSYLEIQHIAKQRFTASDYLKDEPPLSLRFLFKLQPISADKSSTRLELMVVRCELDAAPSTPDAEDLLPWLVRGLINQVFQIELSANNRSFQISHTDNLLKHVCAGLSIDGKNPTKEDLESVNDVVLTILRTHLSDVSEAITQRYSTV